MHALHVMQKCDTPLCSGQPVADAVQLFQKLKIDALPVVNKKRKLLGAVTPQSVVFNPQLDPRAPIDNFLVEAELVKHTVSLEKLHDNKKFDVFFIQKDNSLGVITRKIIDRYMCESLAEKARLFSNILESIHYAVISIDSSEKVTFLNGPAEKILRTTKAASVGQHLSKVINTTGLVDVLKTGNPQLNYEHTAKYFSSTKAFISHRTPIT